MTRAARTLRSGRTPQGAVAVVTGAAGAIGTEIALALDAAGAHLALVDLHRDGLEAVQARLSRPAQLITADLTRAADITRIREEVIARHGACHLLINNAGVVIVEPFETSRTATIETELNVNLLAPALLSREFFPWLRLGRDQGGAWQQGQIVTVVSMAGIVPIAESAVYTASKFGLRGLMLALAQRFAGQGVLVSSILPGGVDTGMLRHEATHGGSPLNFLSEPQTARQVAQAVLASIHRPRLERYVPYGDGLSGRLAMLWPGLLPRLTPLMNVLGERGRQRYLKTRGLTEVIPHDSARMP